MKFKNLQKILVPFNTYKIVLHGESVPIRFETNFKDLDKNVKLYDLNYTIVNFIDCCDKNTLLISLIK